MHDQPVDDPDLFLENMVRMHLVNSRSAFLTSVSYLPALQVAILHEVAAENLLQNGAARVGMFSAKMLARLQARVLAQTGSTAETGKLDFSAVQNGLDALRDKAFLWKAQRGAYWIEDDQYIEWLNDFDQLAKLPSTFADAQQSDEFLQSDVPKG